MITKTLILCSACLVLAGCVTDKISMSSEVSGGGSSTELRSAGVSSIVDSEVSPIGVTTGALGTTGRGLGITGHNGVVANVVGVDPLGGILDGALGQGNIVSQILGTSGGGKGLVPELAAAIAGDPDAVVLGGGLGIGGENGLLADLTGSDFIGAVLGTQGVIPASLAGGNDGLLGALLGNHLASPALGPVAQVVPTSALVNGLAQVPALGVTGQGGVVASLLGTDLVGNLTGTGGVLGGSSSGAIGSQLPQGSTPLLAPLGGAVVGALNVVAGNAPSPLASTGLGTILNNLSAAVPSSASGSLSSAAGLGTVFNSLSGAVAPSAPGGSSGGASAALASVSVVGPVVGQVLGGVTNTLSGPVGGALAPVTQALGAVPILGGLLSGH